ncbi:hypothetical protein BDQ17DRAFT_1377672 [Cyathus striatus]|nr:hypothetical protein BDQ17DRAFT_1377672 [Cyathus striatus]
MLALSRLHSLLSFRPVPRLLLISPLKRYDFVNRLQKKIYSSNDNFTRTGPTCFKSRPLSTNASAEQQRLPELCITAIGTISPLTHNLFPFPNSDQHRYHAQVEQLLDTHPILPSSLVCARIPSVADTLHTSEAILHYGGILTLQSVPEFNDLSLALPKGPPAYEIRKTPTMGYGMYATRDLDIGDLVLTFDSIMEGGRKAGITKTPLPIIDPLLNLAFGRMDDENKKACEQNCTILFDEHSFTFHLRVTVPIEKGEEIFYCYCNPYISAARRQSIFKYLYNFECFCPSCINPHDYVRTSIPPVINELLPIYTETNLVDRQVAQELCDRAMRIKFTIESEGLKGMKEYFHMVGIAATALAELLPHDFEEGGLDHMQKMVLTAEKLAVSHEGTFSESLKILKPMTRGG